jgi:3-methyl-2-oxobutanoate hydroxymethyltransferase
LHDDALAVAAAGASLLVLECVPSQLAADITAAIDIPTIGIGAGPHCDGQVLVLHDLLGIDSGHRRPKFVKDFLADGGSVAGAVRAYAAAVRDGSFPDAGHSYA